MKNKKQIRVSKKMSEDFRKSLLSKAFAVAPDQDDSDISAYLPLPLAMEVIDYIRDINIARRLWNTFTMPQRTWKKPRRATGSSAYHIPDGVQATESGFTSTTVTWEAKKLMTYVTVDEEAVEDSQPDVIAQILQDFGDAFAEAEERALMSGDVDHAATAPDVSSATEANWYVRDPRLMFDGIFTKAAAPAAADSVDGNSNAFDPDMVNKAIYNLGKYGRNKSALQGLVPSEQATNIRGNSLWQDAGKSGESLAAFITGMGSAGEGDGLVTIIFGVKMYEAPFAPAGQTVIYWKGTPQIGDRRKIKLKNDEVIENDQRKYVGSERIAFNLNYDDALVLIDDLSQTIVS